MLCVLHEQPRCGANVVPFHLLIPFLLPVDTPRVEENLLSSSAAAAAALSCFRTCRCQQATKLDDLSIVESNGEFDRSSSWRENRSATCWPCACMQLLDLSLPFRGVPRNLPPEL